MAAEGDCTWLGATEENEPYCRLRGLKLPKPEVAAKCKKPDLSTICIDAYSSLARGQDAIDTNSTDAFPWLIESATQFDNLGEPDNSVLAYIKAIKFATKNDLLEKAYDLFRAAREIYEDGVAEKGSDLNNQEIKRDLVKSGEALIEKIGKMAELAPTTELQSEIKAAVLGGVTLKKANPQKEQKDLIISHGRVLYTKKAQEYKDGAASYIKSGMVKNAVTLACMAALADLMLGKPKEGIAYLTKIAADSGESQTFNEHPCFGWTKLIFKVLVNRDQSLMITVNKQFLEIPWSFKDDREFARRVMESVERIISE